MAAIKDWAKAKKSGANPDALNNAHQGFASHLAMMHKVEDPKAITEVAGWLKSALESLKRLGEPDLASYRKQAADAEAYARKQVADADARARKRAADAEAKARRHG